MAPDPLRRGLRLSLDELRVPVRLYTRYAMLEQPLAASDLESAGQQVRQEPH